MSTQHHTGLTDAQVIESRRIHGANVLTPPVKETWLDVLKGVLKHWISISIAAITVGALVAAVVLCGHHKM